MAKITTRDNMFDDGKTIYDEHGNKIGTQRKDLFGDGVSTYDNRGNKISTTQKDLFGDGVSTYDTKGHKIGTTYEKVFGEGTVTYDTRGNKIAETHTDMWGNTVTDTFSPSGSGYGKSERQIEEEMYAQADAWLDNMRAGIPPRQETYSEAYSAESFDRFVPGYPFELRQAENYLKFVGSLLLKKHRSQISTDISILEREDRHYSGPFNLKKQIVRNRVSVPQFGYWMLNRKQDSSTGGNEYVEEQNFITEQGITSEGQIVEIEFEERYYTSWGVRNYGQTYDRSRSRITQIDISADPGRYIAMVDSLLNRLHEDMNFSRYLSNESACQPDVNEAVRYQESIRKEAEKISKPVKVIDGKLNNWHWGAIIPLVFWLLTVTDRVRIIFGLFFLVWLFVYPVSRFRFEKINPLADNISYEIIVLAASTVLEVLFISQILSNFFIKMLLFNLFFGGIYVCCFLASIIQKRRAKAAK